uniref:Vacuolar protein sorting 33-like protein B isoform 2 n=7 Tax=Catarrhini TaxID=9526 RepID=A0A0S2Z589_HUMAN|nr:vacuolar protein sorting 33-like protein B isoform 2 [Homo sapiens]
MAFPHRPDAPELPDFSMLKRLARDQLIYLLEQIVLLGQTPHQEYAIHCQSCQC